MNFELGPRAVEASFDTQCARGEHTDNPLNPARMATGSMVASESDSDTDSVDVSGGPATQRSGSIAPFATPSASIFEFYANKEEVGEAVKAQCKFCPCPPGKKPVMIQGRIGVTSNFVTHVKVSWNLNLKAK